MIVTKRDVRDALVLLFGVFLFATTSFAQVNLPPVANAGPNQQVPEGQLAQLDGSNSSDPEALPLTYLWTQIAGSTATTSDPTATHLLVIVPSVSGNGGILTFQLTVTDSGGLSASSFVNIIITRVNVAPVASINAPSTVAGGATVTLDGSASFDPNGDVITYAWSQTSGPAIVLNLSDPTKPTFTAPIAAGTNTLQFRLDVSDGQFITTAVASVVVTVANQPPVANAGQNQTVSTGQLVTLDGTLSKDPEGQLLEYIWTQTNGPSVILNLVDPAHPTFTTPNTISTLVFSLVVNDGTTNSLAASTVSVFVFPDALPNCANAQSSKTQLWPPNHTLSRVKIRGLSGELFNKHVARDGDGDDGEGDNDSDDSNDDSTNLQIRVNSVTQDEPTFGIGPGDVKPDAIVQSTRPNGKPRIKDLILIRRERSDTGDGRVYEISFTATNMQSTLSCTGKVQVCVPTKKGKNGICTNSGQNYDSTK
jgi:hypothetical protein